jgi:hypothetical protein
MIQLRDYVSVKSFFKALLVKVSCPLTKVAAETFLHHFSVTYAQFTAQGLAETICDEEICVLGFLAVCEIDTLLETS